MKTIIVPQDKNKFTFKMIWEGVIYIQEFWREPSKTKLGRVIDEKIQSSSPGNSIEFSDKEHEALLEGWNFKGLNLAGADHNRYYLMCLEAIQDAKYDKDSKDA